MLELARGVAQWAHGFKSGVLFLFNTGEEEGLVGAHSFITQVGIFKLHTYAITSVNVLKQAPARHIVSCNRTSQLYICYSKHVILKDVCATLSLRLLHITS